MSASTTTLGSILTSFFNDHLKLQKGLRPNSITSYADAMRLFLQFAAANSQKEDHPAWARRSGCRCRVSSFLNSLEGEPKQRGSVSQPAIGGPPHFLRIRRPAIPGSTGAGSEGGLLFRESVLNLRKRSFSNAMRSKSTLAVLPVEGRHALRDRTLLVFLYNTGARVQEAADLRASDVHFDPTPRVHLHGKGDKWRVCPLWAETVYPAQETIVRRRVPARPTDRPVFIGAKGCRLDPVRNLQDHPPVHHAGRQERIGWPVEADITSRLAPQHGRPPSGSRRRGECHSRLARPCKPGNHQSLR